MLTKLFYKNTKIDKYGTSTCNTCAYLENKWTNLPCLFCITENNKASHFKKTDQYYFYCHNCIYIENAFSPPCNICLGTTTKPAFELDLFEIKGE